MPNNQQETPMTTDSIFYSPGQIGAQVTVSADKSSVQINDIGNSDLSRSFALQRPCLLVRYDNGQYALIRVPDLEPGVTIISAHQ
jgi:hypothetical protein